MRHFKYIISIFIALLVISCNDSFMDRFPQTSISEEYYFKSIQDLDTYTNGLYEILQINIDDVYSDNISTYTGVSDFDNLLRGQVDKYNVGGWTNVGTPSSVGGKHTDWGTLRKCNMLLVNGKDVEGSQADINHYMGIGRFFRAWFYFSQIKRYGSAPWYSKPLKTTDIDLLTKGQDPRTVIVDSIMQDLQFAANNIKSTASRTRVNKWAVLTLMARFALYEGTFRKYHPELRLEDTANEFIEKADSISDVIMKQGGFEITGEGGDGYTELFGYDRLDSNKEIILFADYDKELGRSNTSYSVYNWKWHLSRSLADSYLKLDGTPISLDPSYEKRPYTKIFENRDPRMAETIMPPGWKDADDYYPKVSNPTYGGLGQIKFYPRTVETYGSSGQSYNDLPIFRYAEVLLTNAEAKAELGIITQADVDATINKLRKRVGVKEVDLSNVIDDPVIASQYPNVKGNFIKIILEIRRERRVEMACEGLRVDDIVRWNVGKLLEGPYEGMYIPQMGKIDVTGNDIPNIAIFKTPEDNDLTDEEKKTINAYYLFDAFGKEQGIFLSEGDKGYIRFVKNKNMPIRFIAPKYYYYPIPYKQEQLNPNLKQPDGWQ